MSNADMIADVYRERNDVVFALAWAMKMAGRHVGLTHDPKEPDWPVVMIDTPAGQISWHVPKADIPEWLRLQQPYPGSWDGHNTSEKYARLRRIPYT